MKIVFASLPGFGHTFPLLPLAVAAREVGHDVVYATGENLHPLLRGLGFRTVPAGISIKEAFNAVFAGRDKDIGQLPWRGWLEFGVRVFNDVLPRSVLTDLLPVLRAERPDLVVYEAGNPAAGLAAQRLGIPGVCHSTSRAAALGPADRWQQASTRLLREVAADYGMRLPAGQYLLGDWYLDIFPPSLQEKTFLDRPERVPLRPVPFGGSGELPPIVTAARTRPLVYLTLGTVVGTVPALRAAMQGLSALDVEVVVAVGPRTPLAEFGVLPANVHLQGWLPQAQLLPLVDLAVHHGGSGTTLGAAVAGVPQLMLPVGFDMFVNADVISAAGAGAQLLPDGVERGEDRRRADVVSAAAVTEAAGRLLADPDARQAAGLIAAEIAALPAHTEVAARLAELR